jgi:LuxR family transcriptional regulator, maltose regulon positive regulatory protein
MSVSEHAAPRPLVETKLHAPRRRRGLVHRPRLAGRFVSEDQPALTLVSAPAGFGKTTLVAEWVADGERPTAWLSLDARDNDSAFFWSYLIAAVQVAVPGVGDAALSLLQSDPSAREAVATILLNDLDALATDLVVVLDDYHVIESTDVHESLAFLVEHLPPQVHLVLASRSDPPLALARMRVRGELLEIRAADLRFTLNEASAYFRDAMGLDLSIEDVGALEARTEGWIAALQLAALSLQGRDDVSEFIASFAGDDRFVVDYLAEEVLERQPEVVRDFLLQTAILARLTGSLCDAVTGGSGGTAMLEMLDRANLFLVPLDDQRRWYRYHHLFGDVLRARLMGEQPEHVLELHRRASDWYEANGDRAEAISHATAGEEFERAAQLIELAAPMMRQSRQEATLRRWLEAIPGDLYEARPVLATTLVGAWQLATPPASSRCCRAPSNGSTRRETFPRVRSCSTETSSSAFQRRSRCTELRSPFWPVTSPAPSRTQTGSSSWPRRRIISAWVLHPHSRASPSGGRETSNRPGPTTPTPSSASSRPASSPTCSDAPSHSRTSRSPWADSTMRNGPSGAASNSRMTNRASEAPRTCTSG